MTRSTLGLLVISVAIALLSCTSPEASTLANHPDIVQAQERLPFKMVLPKMIPDGYTLYNIFVNDKPPVGNLITVELVFARSGDDTGSSVSTGDQAIDSFSITQSNQPVGLAGGVVVQINGQQAEYLELERQTDTVRVVAIQVNEQVWASISSLTLSKEDLMTIAESMTR